MTFYEVHRTIAASPQRVWASLTDARALVSGDLGIVRLEGTIAEGATITLWSAVNPGRAFPLRVTAFVPAREMTWAGGLPLGLFSGIRRFTLTPAAAGTEFHMRENYTGLLAPLITKSIPDLTPSFEQFARGLAALAETTAAEETR